MKISSLNPNQRYTIKQISPAIQKAIELIRLVKYAPEINDAFTKRRAFSSLTPYMPIIYSTITGFNNNSKDKTMMVKWPRKSHSETTNRESHQENVELIATEIAGELNLNVEAVKVIARNHDLRHTFYGHSGEWWLSNMKEDLGLGYYCHNALRTKRFNF